MWHQPTFVDPLHAMTVCLSFVLWDQPTVCDLLLAHCGRRREAGRAPAEPRMAPANVQRGGAEGAESQNSYRWLPFRTAKMELGSESQKRSSSRGQERCGVEGNPSHELLFKTTCETLSNRYDFDNFNQPCVQLPTATVPNRKMAIVQNIHF